jgi:hypothetical protein
LTGHPLPVAPLDSMALGERILELLDEGAFSTTYKHALLLALIELCIEKGTLSAAGRVTIGTREIAEKVVDLYWTHTRIYDKEILRQSGRGQAEVLKLIAEFLAYSPTARGSTPYQCQRENPKAWARLISLVEWKLIEMPLPRLQTVGNRNEHFLYEIAWNAGISRGPVRQYQEGKDSGFKGEITLLPGVAEGLVRLSPLLKPMIRRQWTLLVAKLNRLEVSRLESFLFGESRISLAGVRQFFLDVQKGHCFFCGLTLGPRCEVDHFIPWTRYANNAVENLVLAHLACNNNKRDFLASADHVRHWADRMRPGSRHLREMEDFAQETRWDYWPAKSMRVASAIYCKLPERYSLWKGIDQFVPFIPSDFDQIL